MGDRSGMSISADSPLDETLNRGPLVLLLRRQYEFSFGEIFIFIFISREKITRDSEDSDNLHDLCKHGYIEL